ncbi:hypothetical protein LLB_1427 [Legionella longbeachae D-4968]|nr:hypothetical protein LLB_1427 [Legionella longbeachae D-4968]
MKNSFNNQDKKENIMQQKPFLNPFAPYFELCLLSGSIS